MSDAKHMPPSAGSRYELLGGDQVTIKATAADTGGQCTVIETLTPAGQGPPHHVHLREDEIFYVLEGEFEFQVGPQTIRAAAGSFLFAPRGVPHRFVNVGGAPGRLLIIVTPGGFEKFIAAFAELPPREAPDMARMAAIGAAHGLEFLPPQSA